jgi:hypothetical protein
LINSLNPITNPVNTEEKQHRSNTHIATLHRIRHPGSLILIFILFVCTLCQSSCSS